MAHALNAANEYHAGDSQLEAHQPKDASLDRNKFGKGRDSDEDIAAQEA